MDSRRATIVVDLGFGDSGKGTTVDFLTRSRGATFNVRFNGGAQAGHNVVTPEGLHHTFHQFGSGTLAGARTFLSRFHLFDPFSLMHEAEELEKKGIGDPYGRILLDARALVVTPFHKAVNRIEEAIRRPHEVHGTCGMGIGKTVDFAMADPNLAVRARDLRTPLVLAEKLKKLQAALVMSAPGLVIEEFSFTDGDPRNEQLAEAQQILGDPKSPELFAEAYAEIGKRILIADPGWFGKVLQENEVIFEGAQGVCLDQWYGFHPHTTWSTTTFENASTLLGDFGYAGMVEKLGVTRAYATRHGAGPFPTQDNDLFLPDPHNGHMGWQGRFRVGWLDLLMLRYAVKACNGIDGLVMTHIDTFDRLVDQRVGTGYRLPDKNGTMISVLNPTFKQDVEYQQEMGKMLSTVAPIYSPVMKDADYPGVIASLLNVPLLLRSSGPTHKDKVWPGKEG